MLEIQAISKVFEQTKVLENVSFQAQNGDFIGLLGKNGTGKSTILRILADLVTPDCGKILLNGCALKRGDASLITNNDRAFFWRLSALENLQYFLGMSGLKKNEMEHRLNKLADYFGISHKLNNIFSSLSSGEKKKISLLRMLLKDQKIMLFDEVTTALDSETKVLLFNFLKQKQNKIIIWVTHDVEEIKHLCNRYILIKDTRISKEGCLADKLDESLKVITKELVDV